MFSLLDRMIFGKEGVTGAVTQAFIEYEKEISRGRRIVSRNCGDKNNLALAKKMEIVRQGNLVRN